MSYFKVYRGWRDNPVFRGEYDKASAWLWMIEHAAWKPRRFDIKGKAVTLERGQLVASLRFMAEVWGWKKDKVARYLTRLETETMIETATATGETVITICNYDRYQSESSETATVNGTVSATAPRQHRDKTKKVKKVKKVKKL